MSTPYNNNNFNQKPVKAEATKKEKTVIEVEEHVPFEGDMKTNLVSTIDMADVVNSLFSSAFADYHGCDIRINNGENAALFNSSIVPRYSIYVNMYFKDRGANNKPIKNLKRRGAAEPKHAIGADGKPTNNLAARYAAVNETHSATNTGRVYDVTPETYEALEEFMFNTATNRNIRWSDYTQEMSVNMGVIGSKEEAIVCVTGLSLDKILTKIYGGKTDEGEFEYATSPSTMIPFQAKQFIIQVVQLNLATVRKLQRSLGNNSPFANNGPQYSV